MQDDLCQEKHIDKIFRVTHHMLRNIMKSFIIWENIMEKIITTLIMPKLE